MDEIIKEAWGFVKIVLSYAYGDKANIKMWRTRWAIIAISIISGIVFFILFFLGKTKFQYTAGYKAGAILSGVIVAVIFIGSISYTVKKESTNKKENSTSNTSRCKYLPETLERFPANIKVSLDPIGYLEMVFLSEGNATHIEAMPKRVHVIFKSKEFVELIARHRYGISGEGYGPYIDFHEKRKKILEEGLKQGMLIEELHNIDSLVNYCKNRQHNGVDIPLDPKYFRDMLRRWKMLLIASIRMPIKCKYYVRLTSKDIFLKYEIIDDNIVLIHEPVGSRSKTRLNALMIQGTAVTQRVERDFRERWEHQCIDEVNAIDYRDNKSVIKFIDEKLFPYLFVSNYEKKWFHRLQALRNEFSARAEKYLRYATTNGLNDCIELEIINRIVCNKNANLSVLEIGSGVPTLSKLISRNCSNITRIVALDICEEMIINTEEENIEICVAPAEEIPFEDNSFDIVVAKNSLQYLNNDSLSKVISELHRILCSTGHFIFAQNTPCTSYADDTLQQWIALSKCAEPLSQSNYTKQQWSDLFIQNQFNLSKTAEIKINTSVGKWEVQTAQIETKRVSKYSQMLRSSSEHFKQLYEISERDGDVWFTEFWTVFEFVNN